MLELELLVSNYGLDPEFDLFEQLHYVYRKDINQYGLLFLTRDVNWTNPIIEKADWIDGCQVPKAFKDDPRLLLGFHTIEYVNVDLIEDSFVYEGETITQSFISLYI